MTQQEIQERNKEIALMLGWSQNQNPDHDGVLEIWWPVTTLEKPWGFRVERLEFHSDWNWLMEAVEFIESKIIYTVKIISTPTISQRWYMYTVQIYNTRSATLLTQGEKIIEIQSHYHKNQSKKETVFIAVSDFAKMYNKNKV
jgi:hypothetical protein